MALKETKSPTIKLMKGEAAAPVEATVASLTEGTKEVPDTTAEGPLDMIVLTAHEIENLKEDKAFKMIPQLLNNIDHDYFRLGGVLSLVQAQGWYMDKNYENFRAFVEAETGILYRKAMYLIQIYNGLVESGVTWEKVKHLGWSKLKELAVILTPENVDDWVDRIDDGNMTVLQIQEYIKSQSAGTVQNDEPESLLKASATTTMTFKLHEDQKATIREALDKVKHQTGTEFDAVALEHMALDFLGGDSKLKAVPTLAELMKGKSAEEVLGVFGTIFPEVTLEATLP
jgi:hypothetical protein